MEFQFDPAKAAGNLRKHGVSFADAEACLWIHSRCIESIRMPRVKSGSWHLALEALVTYSSLFIPCAAKQSD
jgi:hypothetical protein